MKIEHPIYNSIDEMIRPEILGALSGFPVTAACLAPFQTQSYGATEAPFYAVQTNEGKGPQYVIKGMSIKRDWLMQTTDDHLCRSAAFWKYGLFDRMPPEIDPVVVACAKDKNGWSILMRDITEMLLPDGKPISVRDHFLVLDGLAALHAAFWEDPSLRNPQLGLCPLPHLFTSLSAEVSQCLDSQRPNEIFQMIISGWELLPTLIEPEIADHVRILSHDPTPLVAKLAVYPKTLLHGDPRIANLGIIRAERSQLVMLDFARSTRSAPTIDLAWYLGDILLPVSIEESIKYYKQCLMLRLGDRFSDTWWQPMLDLGLLAGFVLHAWVLAYMAVNGVDERERSMHQASVAWWSKAIVPGIERLSE